MSESPDSATEAPLEIEINNDVEKDYTLIKVRIATRLSHLRGAILAAQGAPL
jgi:hypothetical protein